MFKTVGAKADRLYSKESKLGRLESGTSQIDFTQEGQMHDQT